MLPTHKDQQALDRRILCADAKSISASRPVKPRKPFSWSKTLGRIALYSLAILLIALIDHLFSSGPTPFADFAMWCCGPLLVGSVVILALISEQQEIRRKNGHAINEAAFLDGNKTADIYITEGYGHVIGVDWDNCVIFIGDTLDNVETVPFADLLEVSVDIDAVTETVTTSNTKTNRGSQIGSAAAAGLLLGPAGLIVGGLSAGSKTKGKSIANTLVKSITLVVRVRSKSSPVRRLNLLPFTRGRTFGPNHGVVVAASKKAAHYRALLTQIIEDRASSAVAPAAGPNALPMADQIDRLWTLHEKGALTRAEYDTQKTKLLSAAKTTMTLLAAMGTMLFASVSAKASDIGKVLKEKPEATFTSKRPMFDLERCLVYADMPFTPSVYRAPDRPNESLLYEPRPPAAPTLTRLRTENGTTTIDVWHAQYGKQVRAARQCVEDGE